MGAWVIPGCPESQFGDSGLPGMFFLLIPGCPEWAPGSFRAARNHSLVIPGCPECSTCSFQAARNGRLGYSRLPGMSVVDILGCPKDRISATSVVLSFDCACACLHGVAVRVRVLETLGFPCCFSRPPPPWFCLVCFASLVWLDGAIFESGCMRIGWVTARLPEATGLSD
jgi:hypothetical protein